MLKIISSLISVALVINLIVNFKFNSPDEADNGENASGSISTDKPQKKLSNNSKRNPASKNENENDKKIIYKPSIKRSEVDPSNFSNISRPLKEESTPNVSGGSAHPTSHSTVNHNTALPPLIRENAGTEPLPKNADGKLSLFTGDPLPTALGKTIIAANKIKNPLAVSISSPSGNSTASSLPSQNTCTSNIAGGAFNNPIGINLSCSSVSTIKYCLALDTGAGCCNPMAGATTYSSQIVIGPKNGNYCLSYYGQSGSGTSVVYQQSYTINSALPNLQVAQPQINYQTTQLNGKSLITSTDFGKTGYGIGQINLKSHDPGPSGLNYTCDDIMANYVSLPAPTPVTVLSLLDVSLDNPTIQIEIPLQVTQLDYGDNFLTSYIENNNFVAPIYSCSTSKITLNDFEFFQEELAFGDPGTNTTREFTGGFSPYGFFEDATTVYRGPAGVDTLNNTGQKLEYGMFGIFY